MIASRRISAVLSIVASISLASCGGGGGGSNGGNGNLPVTPPIGTAPPSVAPTTGPSSAPSSAYTCPTSDSTTSVARSTRSSAGEATRHYSSLRRARSTQPLSSTIAVTYDRAMLSRSAASIASRETAAGATTSRTIDFAHTGLTTHVLSVPAARVAALTATLRAQPGVKSVATTGYRRFSSAITNPYLPNDPYFDGFTGTSAPYRETPIIPGQWDMHAIGLEDAFAYSQAGNGSSVAPKPGALGLSTVKIAVIDTGEDTTHPELNGKIVYQKCFITNASGTSTSTSNFTTDPFGHGTDVSGIAAAATGNGVGFSGAGGNVSLMGYRVFPTPDDTCTSDTTADAQCSADPDDIASAITDAVSNGADVISMSLGGGSCSAGGVDQDPVEGNAVANAIAAHVIVVASSGNDSAGSVESPACDAGVIAAGASSLSDGTQNGTYTSSEPGTSSVPVEYVASYSDYGSPGAQYRNSAAWGIVAPGGDPGDNDVNGSTTNDLHWIENIWTSQPFDSNFSGNCTADFGGTTIDCRTLIAGTSMSAPHVAGAAALILSVNAASYHTASQMKQLLCTTTDDLGGTYGAHEGCGRLNIYRAMAVAVGDPTPP